MKTGTKETKLCLQLLKTNLYAIKSYLGKWMVR